MNAARHDYPLHAALEVLNGLGGDQSALAELDHLRCWKAEAIQVLDGWEGVWEAMGKPGPLGELKSTCCLMALMERL